MALLISVYLELRTKILLQSNIIEHDDSTV